VRERAREQEKGCDREIEHAKERADSLCLLLHSRVSRSLCVCVYKREIARAHEMHLSPSYSGCHASGQTSSHEIISQRTALAHAVDDGRCPLPPLAHAVGRCPPRRGHR